ncbi:MAG: hypothetical protein Q9217_005387 [Psora testacea]
MDGMEKIKAAGDKESTPASTIIPRLSKRIVGRRNWGRFIDIIKEQYKHNARDEIKPDYIVFKAGEHPILPFEGHKFLRFSSKVWGAIAAASEIESYIKTVTLIAKAHFGSRVQYFDVDDFNHPSPGEIHDVVLDAGVSKLLQRPENFPRF